MIRKLILFGLILAGHYGLFLWLDAATRYRIPNLEWQTRTEVTFVAPPVPQVVEIQRRTAVKQQTPAEQSRMAESIPTTRSVRSHAPADEKSGLRILDSDGRVWIPQSAKDEFLTHGQTRQFDIQRSGLDDMDALLKRPVILDYRSTRFDAAWQGDKPRLTRILETAVEKTTATVKIPVPGRPGAHLQCKLMVLAASGGCGFTANDDGYFVAHDDPETLSPKEERQCRAWWNLIISAKTQAEWRRTRSLYEQECRKPQAKP